MLNSYKKKSDKKPGSTPPGEIFENKNLPPPLVCAIGIDPSLTGTGLCAILNHDIVATRLISTKPQQFRGPPLRRFQRYFTIVQAIVTFIKTQTSKRRALIIGIENYAFGSVGNYQTTAAELGGLIRAEIIKTYGEDVLIEITPTSLKKQITGNGRASKKEMIEAIARIVGEKVNHNIADAIGLAIVAGGKVNGK